MAAGKDKLGRPIVVVTGLGVVTSLGAGKTNPASRPSRVFLLTA
jgi:3-oxoacyl-[acyl-carrier-protein] synthase II